MKKIIKIIVFFLMVMSIKNVYAENHLYHNFDYFPIDIHYLEENALVPNDSYITQYQYYNIENGETIKYDYLWNFYDEEGNLIETQIPKMKTINDDYIQRYYGDELYYINSNNSILWRLKSKKIQDNKYVLNLQKEPLKENQNVYTFRANGGIFDNTQKVKRGDIAIFTSNSTTYIDYNEYYQYTLSRIHYGNFIIGYEIEDQNKKISSSLDEYLVSFNGGSSTGCGFYFQEYKDPTFSINCNKNGLNKNEETICSFNMRTIFDLNTLDIKIPNSKDFTIQNIESSEEKYKVSLDSDTVHLTSINYQKKYDYYLQEFLEMNPSASKEDFQFNDDLSEYKLDDYTDVELFTFNLKSNVDVNNVNDLISTFDVNYKVSDVEEDTKVRKTIKILEFSNPQTVSNLIIFIVTSIIIVLLIILHKKNIIKEIES